MVIREIIKNKKTYLQLLLVIKFSAINPSSIMNNKNTMRHNIILIIQFEYIINLVYFFIDRLYVLLFFLKYFRLKNFIP